MPLKGLSLTTKSAGHNPSAGLAFNPDCSPNGFTASKCKFPHVHHGPYRVYGSSRGTHMEVQMARLESLPGNTAGRTAHPRSGLQGRTNKVPRQNVNRSAYRRCRYM